MKKLNSQDLYDALGGVSDRHLVNALPPSWKGGAMPAKKGFGSRLSEFFLDNGWVAAVLSGVVAVGVIVAIVLAGRGGPGSPPVGGSVAEESEREVVPDSLGESESGTVPEPESLEDPLYCLHDTATWVYVDENFHDRHCPTCGESLRAQHNWAVYAEEGDTITYHCRICGGETVEAVTELETAAESLPPDPLQQPMSSPCLINVYFDQQKTELRWCYIYAGNLVVADGPGDVVNRDHIYNPSGLPMDGNYLRGIAGDPNLPTVYAKDPSTYKKTVGYIGNGLRPNSESYVIYDEQFNRVVNALEPEKNVLIRDLTDGIYYVVLTLEIRGDAAKHKIGNWTLQNTDRHGWTYYNAPFRLVVGDVEFTPPTYPSEGKNLLMADFDGLAVVSGEGRRVLDSAYLYQASMTDAAGNTVLSVNHPMLYYSLAGNMLYSTTIPHIYVDSAEELRLEPVKTDLNATIVSTRFFDRGQAPIDLDMKDLPDGQYLALIDIEFSGASQTIDGQTYAGGTARYTVYFVIHIGEKAP